ncbi:DUF4258 domain-containing protein [Candidatus Pacearchaeota archaeon]|nr:DUF4258 domain-containing protein [Candidatus Pacearchaeota archaeon]
MNILFSRHALEQMRERGVSINEIKEVMQNGAKFIQDNDKIVADYRHIRVIFKKLEEQYFVITVMIRK